ncbi:hypothetical protein [Brevundimonas sp.]|uniref:hypothetical protein n=1 Tax=Brevundimonas sp. TaxID=1871086 RepID=UPI002FCA315C
MILNDDDVQALERALAERLFEIARSMTAIGLEGEDPNDPHIAALIEEAFENARTTDEVKAFIAKRRIH